MSQSLPEHSNRVYLPAAVTAALFVLAVVLLVRGGISPDMTGMDPSSIDNAHQLIASRFVGILTIVLSSLLPLVVMAAGALGMGLVLRRLLSPAISLLTYATAGLGLVWLLFEMLSLAGQANAWSAWGVCIASLIAGLLCHAPAVRKMLGRNQSFEILPLLRWHWSSVLIAVPIATMLVAACCPPGTLWAVEAYGYDVMSYHLQIPREWLAAGRITGLEHNVYSYLPSLVETGFAQLGAMQGSMYDAVYTCQLMSVCLSILAAAHLARLVGQLAPGTFAPACQWFTASVFLATPWVLITGSMAYDEAAALAMGAAAISLSLESPSENQPAFKRWHIALLVGLLAGLATQAKLTSALMIAIPAGLTWWLMESPVFFAKGKHLPIPTTYKVIGMLVLAGSITLCPYLLRNAIWTGNPLFPNTAKSMGLAHWDDELADRWNRGHHVDATAGERIKALGQQWVFNTGYGAVGGRLRSKDPASVETRNIAYFPRQWGFPTLLLASLIGWIVLVVKAPQRWLPMALLAMAVFQILAWAVITHLQSRFMIFSLLPMCIAAGAGLSLAANLWLQDKGVIPHALMVILVGIASLTGIGLLQQQTIGRVPLWYLIDSLPTVDQATVDNGFSFSSVAGDHPINHLPANSKTLLVADNARLFYIHRPILYNTAFDANPLGRIIREHPGDAAAVTAALKDMGITHVWVHGPELDRLMTTYGYDKDVNADTLVKLIHTGWKQVYPIARTGHADQPAGLLSQVVLYALP